MKFGIAADAVKVHWHDLESPLRKALAAIYSDIKEWATAKTLWRELIGEGIQELQDVIFRSAKRQP